ncbi:glycosyltransferase [Maridesulfovibrio hydrothermalis]|uniref:Uncharacterized protein n=1 Tax=Maridesulfovibrio hydrothermalis AM13 = DSM 14728 TaxID=1121451 RepID=L0RAG7_9BACT|nr:glycosyltransferase [Maridesulfovibrio hydrothermalis]CCO23207.1 protein of unknown function [Maridesulfovibrio hydrothermalis AM13 = DSM 14728]
MRIAHIGNLANLGFLHCFFLRKAGIDAHLYVNDTVKILPIPYENGNVVIDYDWIHRYPRKNLLAMFANQFPLALELSKYDLVHSWTCSLLPLAELILALKNKSYFAYATGSDLREAGQRITANGFRIRRHFKNAAYVAHTFDMLTLQVSQKIQLKNCGLLKIPVGNTAPKTYDTDQSRETIFFLPSRLHFTPKDKHELVFKNNNRFIFAFARYVKAGGKAHLILLRRGSDYKQSMSIIKQLGIEKDITWKNEMTPIELSNFFYKCDVVIDQFNDLSYPLPGGALAIEAMAHGTPVMIGNDVELNKKFYGTCCPNLSCSTEDEILDMIVHCEDKTAVKKAGLASKEWINTHHGWKVITDELIRMYSLYIAED